MEDGDKPQAGTTPDEESPTEPSKVSEEIKESSMSLPFDFRDKKILMGIGIILVVVIVIGAAAMPILNKQAEQEGNQGGAKKNYLTMSDKIGPIQGESKEGAAGKETDLNLNATYIIEVTLTLQWSDDMGSPDTFRLTLISPDGQKEDGESDGGSITVTIKTNITEENIQNNSGGWKAIVECIDAGDEPVGPFGFLVYVDDGNSWQLTGKYQYLVEEE